MMRNNPMTTQGHRISPLARLSNRTFELGRKALGDESGQLFPWMALLLMFIFLGLAALSLDAGHAMYIQRELQASADAAALAAAQRLPDTTTATGFHTVGENYGDAGKNQYWGGVTFDTPIVNGVCLETVKNPPFNTPCLQPGSSTAYAPNAVQVTESATFNTYFAGILGHDTMKVSAMATAASEAGRWNIAIILDTTPSMGYADSSCGSNQTQLSCAEGGISTLLAGLDQNSDYVALFTFPPITVGSTSADTTCNGGSPQVAPYVFPSASGTSYTSTSTPYVTGSGTTDVTYQVTAFTNTFQAAGDPLQTAVGNGKNSHGTKCGGMQTSMEFTYLAGAIYAAQAALLAQQKTLSDAGVSSQNAMIILSDGNATSVENNPTGAWNALTNDMLSTSAQVGGGTNYATSSGTYPSWVGQCGQEVVAAQAAATYPGDNTRVYTVAYGSPTNSASTTQVPYGNCASDRTTASAHPYISPCGAMQQMTSNYVSTSNDPYFFADGMGTSGCTAMAGNDAIGNLAGIFNAIRGSLLYSRLVPNNTN